MRNLSFVIVIIGVAVALVPVLVPVWDVRYTERGRLLAFDASGKPVAGRTDQDWDREKVEQRRGLLFAGPKLDTWRPAPQADADGGRTELLVTADNVQASPQFGRLILESLAMITPFALAAFAVRSRVRRALPVGGGFEPVQAPATAASPR